jgi:formylglycine-generating enzyme required for sulfatase activity
VIAVLAQSAPADRRPGFIQVKSEAGVRIFLDGKDSGSTARDLGGLVIQDVLPGTYVIQARKEGFRAQEMRVSVLPGAVHLVYVLPFRERAGAAAEAAITQYTGTLIIRSVPVDCRLRIPDLLMDAQQSEPEYRNDAIPAGAYDIEATALGQTLKQTVTVEADRTADVLFNFVRGEVQVVMAQPAPAVTKVPAPAAPTAAAIEQLEALLQATERELGEVRGELQAAKDTVDLTKIRGMMERRDELDRKKRDLSFELNAMRQRGRDETESARREDAERKHKAFAASYAEFTRILRDPDLPAELKARAWQDVCKSWAVEPGASVGRLLWDEARTAPYKVLSRVVQLEGGVELELVEIVAGVFAMGSEDGDDDEKPVHPVSIARPFWIGKYEVTQAQYRAVTGSMPAHFRGDNRPVENVTWLDADGFCKRLTEREKKAGRLLGSETFRLPTEAEWEYACRAGTTTSFSYADQLAPALANYDVSQGAPKPRPTPARETLPVGSFKPSPWDLYDMHGNVWEWCADWYDREYYGRSPQLNPFNVRPSGAMVCRGGSWINPASFCRSANRNSGDPRQANHMTGFRVVLGPPPVP